MEARTRLTGPAGERAELVVVGASAGGLDALLAITARLPRDFGATMLVVIHIPPHRPSRLPEVISRRARLPAAHATDGEPIQPGRIRVAPPDHHLAVHDGQLHLSRGPRQNRHRPSIDVLFRTAAAWYGNRVIGVILSGGPGDGMGGVRALEEVDARILVQDPAEALFADMPLRALEAARSARRASVDEIAGELAAAAAVAQSQTSKEVETPPMEPEMELAHANREGWRASTYACPDCSGVLWEKQDGELLRFRCRVGHGYAGEALLDSKADELEVALWSAINTMEERAELAERLSGRAQDSGYADTANRYAETARDMRGQAQKIRNFVAGSDGFRLEPVEPGSGAVVSGVDEARN